SEASRHLIRVDVPVPAGAPAGRGGVRVSIEDQLGGGNVQMWRDSRKRRSLGFEHFFHVSELPATFYLEGRENSNTLRDVQLIATYVTAPGTGIAVGSDVVNLTVTPVVGNLTVSSDTVGFFDRDGYRGMSTPALPVQADMLTARGFTMQFILVITNVDN